MAKDAKECCRQCQTCQAHHATTYTNTQNFDWTALADGSSRHTLGASVNKQQSILACDTGLLY